ncbi:MAG: hypothetical protein IIC35_03315 [Gemmatimonadetes bacterium]|nr:hypothetical protein [Gemmatimonadota bacterium]
MTESADPPKASDENVFEADAHVVLFGFPSTQVRVTVQQRSRAWRVGGAARTFGMFVVIAFPVALMPPHAVWFIGALVTGGVFARRRLIERFTLHAVDVVCPKCESPICVKKGRLRVPHPLPCDACHHESSLKLPEGLLEERDTR